MYNFHKTILIVFLTVILRDCVNS